MAIWNERIRKKRLEKAMTLVQVAETLGVTEATAQRYESGKIKNIPYDHLCAYGQLFLVNPAYFMGWNEPMSFGATDDDTTEPSSVDFLFSNSDLIYQTIDDAMLGSRIKKGDYVFVCHDSTDVDTDNDIIMLKFNDNILLRRLILYHGKELLVLKADHQDYQDIVLVGEERKQVQIIGKVIGFQSSF